MRFIRPLTALGSLALLAGTATPASGMVRVPTETGVTATTITLGTHLPLTGPASPGYKDVGAAIKAYFDYVNAKGGINHRKVNFIVKDDKYDPAQTKRVVSSLILQDKVFAIMSGLGTATHSTVVKDLNRRGIPDLMVLSGYSGFANAHKYPDTWPGFPSYIAEAKIMSKFIADTDSLKSLKACLLYQDDDFGRDAAKGFAIGGMSFAAKAGYNAALLASSGVKAQIAGFAAQKCELVVVFGVTAATASAIGTAKALGFSPTWLASAVGADKKTLDDLNVPKALLTGVYSPNFLPVAEDASDGYIALITKILGAANVPVTSYTIGAVNDAYLVAQAIKAVGKKLTRKGLIAAMAKAANFKTAAFVPFKGATHQGYSGYYIGRYGADLVQKRVSAGVYETDSGSGPVQLSTFNRPAAPANLLP
ncbi:MAG: ABC transporter substrate-binding protein [Candidatus Nanopelagicales bacterium]